MSSPWEVRMSSSKGLPYFFNADTKESSWDAPAGLSDDDINKLPGAQYLKKREAGAGAGKEGQVRASHLLIKHCYSRRPSSWKEGNITRTKEEAISILESHQSTINASQDKRAKFAELASEDSDCSSHSHGGDLGWFGRGQMQAPFEQAAYGLEVGDMSEIISTDSGVHLVLRTG